ISFGPYTLYNAAPLVGPDIFVAKFGSGLTGVHQPEECNHFSIFPNPVSDKLLFENGILVEEDIITNVSCSVVEKITCPPGVIDVNHLTNGIYFISLHFSDNKVFTRKFIKH